MLGSGDGASLPEWPEGCFAQTHPVAWRRIDDEHRADGMRIVRRWLELPQARANSIFRSAITEKVTSTFSHGR
jgi:hypothetical protein